MPDPISAAEQVAANVKLLRARRGYSQDQLAARMGLKSAQVVWAAEVGRRRITVSDLAAFAEALEVTATQLLSHDPELADHAGDALVYEVTVDGGITQSFAADTVDPGDVWTSFYLQETRVFLAPTARVLGIRLLLKEATDVR
ncbi:helix-turn-helix transcriptional regulator [Streptomyces sp. ME02-7008A-1]|uniref:helix-turn-helix domain-containing protein n=1 Tax=unclassified Streptomyces TaxID=2593676 RepID=UPI0029B84836|nr:MULTISPECIES: helix-turn-helix transcriptional regulator [unclassified Streptomyces]MDX3183475.1 helix-turn-helix transcriptional regulator [Streptomyces sp. ME02-7008A-1]MDX3303927.1 helix-turn-helix transcriptional regulator [Streptomyces sp. ME02-7008A]